MRVLVTGGYGLIGSAILARLHRDGHTLIGAGRSLEQARRRFPYSHWIEADFDRLRSTEAWRPLLAGIDAVVNCVGALQDGARDDVQRVQSEAACALFDACVQAGIRRVIQISAIGADRAGPTAFTRTKAEADACLAGLDIDWIILRLGLVLGEAVYGGSAILRGTAGVPLVTPLIAADSRILVVSMDDVVTTVAFVLAPGAPARCTWDVCHPQPVSLGEIVLAVRRWLGFPPRPVVRVPRSITTCLSVLADALGWLGWRSPARSTAIKQLTAGMYADPSAWMTATGIRSQSLDDILATRPASLQDRWHARLYFFKPLAIATLAAFWILTGLIALGPGWEDSMRLLAPLGLSGSITAAVVVGGALLDMALGAALLVRSVARRALIAMLVVCLAYLMAGTAVDPGLWAHPLGPLTKIAVVMLATLFTLSMMDER
jgi:uncharacterized protein YbjT (DUF2867 family)